MSNVISIAGNSVHIPGEPCEEVVDILESLLADAKAGNVQTLFVAGRMSNGAVYAAYEFQDSPTEYYALVGAVECVKADLLDLQREPTEE